MALTTHEKIRVEAGFQSRFNREAFLNAPDSGSTTFYVRTDDNTKLVPEFSTGNTNAGVSDVQVYLGLSGVFGSSRMTVASVNPETGAVTLTTAPVSGSSLTVNYASSAIPNMDVNNVLNESSSIVNQRLSLCYDTPLQVTSSSITSLTTRLASALLLIRSYGTGSRSTANDGYALYEQIMGQNQRVVGIATSDPDVIVVGELGLICSPGYQIVDDNGTIIPRNDDGLNTDNTTFVAGGRSTGRLYDITEEAFRKKPYQQDVNTEQQGSGNINTVPIQP